MKKYLLFLFSSIITISSFSQMVEEDHDKEPPAYKILRSTENYSYLRNLEDNPYETDFFDPIKFIGLSNSKRAYISIGGQFRPRFEYFSNRFWEENEDLGFYSQRLTLHTNVVLGEKIRVFGELYHGRVSREEEFAESDKIDIQQAFVDFIFPMKDESAITVRLGRQEMPFGSERLVGLREGANIRRSFDAGRMIYSKQKTKIQAFYSKEVRPEFEAFDNKFTLLDDDAINPSLWGLNVQFQIGGLPGINEIYFFGFESPLSTFNDVSAEEDRKTIGLRRYGKLGRSERFSYNTELIYQFGTIGNADISAFDIEGDWGFLLSSDGWKPEIGLKLQYTSGDDEDGDNMLGTFNPMFENPAYYSLAANIAPQNIIGIHPSIRLRPTEKLMVYLEWAFFRRASENDGLYRPPRFLSQEAEGRTKKGLGNQVGLQVSYEVNRHLGFELDMSYFSAGSFQKTTGVSDPIFHIAPTMSYRF